MSGKMNIVAGTYRILRKIGQGGMGSVHAAEKITTHKVFAIKFMNREYVESPAYLARFKREIEALMAIRHPNVVNVFDWYLPTSGREDSPYIVMELLEGRPLSELLKSARRLSVRDTISIMLQILDGLVAMHEADIVHRDLGPTNVFLVGFPEEKYHVKILDFGLAKPLSKSEQDVDVTGAGAILGKAGYVGPELFLGRRLDAASDIFSCGMMMMRMLTGRLPFKESRSELLWGERYSERESMRDYPSAHELNPGVPKELSDIVSRAIKRNPDSRYGNVQEMQADLLRVEKRLDAEDADAATQKYSPPGQQDEPEADASAAGEKSIAPVETETKSAPGLPVDKLMDPRSTGRGIAKWNLGALVIIAPILMMVVGGVVYLLFIGPGRQGSKTSFDEAEKAQPAPAEVNIVVLGVPEGGVAKIGDTELGGDPPAGQVAMAEEPVELIVVAEGFKIYRQEITPDQNRIIRVAMEKIEQAPAVQELEEVKVEGAIKKGGAKPAKEKPAATKAEEKTEEKTRKPEETIGPLDKKDEKLVKGRHGTTVITDFNE